MMRTRASQNVNPNELSNYRKDKQQSRESADPLNPHHPTNPNKPMDPDDPRNPGNPHNQHHPANPDNPIHLIREPLPGREMRGSAPPRDLKVEKAGHDSFLYEGRLITLFDFGQTELYTRY